MKYLVESIEYKDYDENNRAWWIVYFVDENGVDYYVEGYESSYGSVESVDGTKNIPCELVDLCMSHFDPYTSKLYLEENEYITLKGA